MAGVPSDEYGGDDDPRRSASYNFSLASFEAPSIGTAGISECRGDDPRCIYESRDGYHGGSGDGTAVFPPRYDDIFLHPHIELDGTPPGDGNGRLVGGT